MINKSFTSYYLYCLALFFLVAMHYYQVNSGGYGLTIAFNNTSWIAISFIIALTFFKLAMTKTISISQMDIILGIIILVLFIPLFWSLSPWNTTVYDRYLAIIIGFLVVVLNRQFSLSAKEKVWFWALICSSALIQSIIGLVQFSLADDQNPLYYRPYGTLQQINVYASFLATGLGISIYQLLASQLSRYLTLLYYCTVFLTVLMLGVVLSRIGVLGGGAVALGLFMLFKKQKLKILSVSLVALLAIGLVVVLKDIKPESNRTNITSVEARSILYTLSIELIKERPLLGHGLGRFRTTFLEKKAQYLSENSELKVGTIVSSHPHNEILFWWVEAGVLPVLALLVFGFGFTFVVWRKGSVHNKAIWLCVLPILLHTQTEYPLYQSAPHLFILMLLLSSADSSRIYTFPYRFIYLSKFLAFLFPLVALIFMLINLHSLWLIEQYTKDKNIAYISKIINPSPIKHLVNRVQAETLLEYKTLESLTLAEDIINEEIALRPSEGAYWLKYQILFFLNKKEQALQHYKEGSYLFPSSTVFNDPRVKY